MGSPFGYAIVISKIHSNFWTDDSSEKLRIIKLSGQISEFSESIANFSHFQFNKIVMKEIKETSNFYNVILEHKLLIKC